MHQAAPTTASPRGTLGTLRRRVAYAQRATRAVLRDPSEGAERVLERVGEWRERHRPAFSYTATVDWHAALHDLLGASSGCDADSEFDSAWQLMIDELAARGVKPGRGTFHGWDDGGRALVRAVYCVCRHKRPARIVETGVAHGVTTRFVLDALERNQHGRLWSVDLPPLIAPDLRSEVGVAVPTRLRERWTLIEGSTRRKLRSVLAQAAPVDLFVHDSMHTTRNMRFELDHAWRVLAPGGVIVADDIDFNAAFGEFAARADATVIVARHDDVDRLFGILVRNPHTTPAAEHPAGPRPGLGGSRVR
jgi:predicted O-methyltransferase YrrM